MRRRRLLTLVASLALGSLLFCLLSGIVTYQRWQRSALETNIRNVKVGDTKERVIELLGEPRARFAKGGQIWDALRQKNLVLNVLIPQSPETWVYGSFAVMRLGASDKDYLIEFDDKGRVSRVALPAKPETSTETEWPMRSDPPDK